MLHILGFLISLLVSASYAYGAGCTGANYGTFECPFAASSIWNKPIQNGARYTDAGLSPLPYPAGQAKLQLDPIGKLRLNNTDPIKNVYKRGGSCFTNFARMCGEGFSPPHPCDSEPWDYLTNTLLFSARLPTDFVHPDCYGNCYIATIKPDGTIGWGGLGASRCQLGGIAGSQFKGEEGQGYNIAGDGLSSFGHGASKMSIPGGVLLAGELTDSAPIRHALKIELVHHKQWCKPDEPDGTPGYRWPAKGKDGGACTAGSSQEYGGTVPGVQQGSLLALLPSFNCAALTTSEARKFCGAVKTYGAYVPDSCCGGFSGTGTDAETMWILVIEGYRGKLLVVDELKHPNPSKIDLVALATGGAGCNNYANLDNCTWDNSPNERTIIFKQDMDVIYDNLHVVDDVSATGQCPKGCKRPTIVEATRVDATHTTLLLDSPDLALAGTPVTCTALTVKDNGSNETISACTIAGATVNLTHGAITGTGTVDYSEQGVSNTSAIRTVVDAPASGITPARRELQGFVNFPIAGTSEGGGTISAYQYTDAIGGTLDVADDFDDTWDDVPGYSNLSVVSGSCADAADCSATIKFLWSPSGGENQLCVFADVNDAGTLQWDTPANRFQDDVFEFSIDRSNNGGVSGDADNLQLRSDQDSNCVEEITSGHTSITCRYATKTGGYQFMACMPSSTFGGGAFSTGQLLGLDARQHDDDNGGTTKEAVTSSAGKVSGGTWTDLIPPVTLISTSIVLSLDNPAPNITFAGFTEITTTSAKVNLTTNEEAVCTLVGEPDPGEAPWDITQGPTSSGTTHQFSLTSLLSATTYDVEVTCSDGVNTSEVLAVSFTTQGATASTVRQSHFRFYDPGPPSTPIQPNDQVALVAEDTAVEMIKGGIVVWRVQLTCDGGAADCAQIGVVPYASYDGGGYTLIPDSCETSDLCYWTTFTSINNGQELTTEKLTSTYGNLIGQAFNRQSVAFMGGTNSDDTEKELVFYFAIPDNAVSSTIDLRLQVDGGAVLAGGYQAETARINVISSRLIRLGF